MKAKPRRRAPNLLRNPAVASFIVAGRNFCELFAGPQPPPEEWCGAALWCLSQLYLAACALPETRWDEKLDRWENPFVLTDRDRARVTHVAEAMLGGARRYRVWLDPRREPEDGEEPEEGDLVQDLAEIYREIKPGLTAARRAGVRVLPRVVLAWKYPSFESSWGIVALNAMRALHALVYGRPA
ncbi:MAG: DUF5063 domain-containing protein [Planctomycetes bacterium]|nr:DUF5063 domain-containing protein [Planctomycetota bacterium]